MKLLSLFSALENNLSPTNFNVKQREGVSFGCVFCFPADAFNSELSLKGYFKNVGVPFDAISTINLIT